MIPVCRPRLPDADAILPYLRRIDDAAWYSNFGPLVRELEARLGAHFGTGDGTVATVANGTMGLGLALAAPVTRGGRWGPLHDAVMDLCRHAGGGDGPPA